MDSDVSAWVKTIEGGGSAPQGVSMPLVHLGARPTEVLSSLTAFLNALRYLKLPSFCRGCGVWFVGLQPCMRIANHESPTY